MPLYHRDTGSRTNPHTESNSCFSDFSDSLNSLHSLNSMTVLLHLEKKPIITTFSDSYIALMFGLTSRGFSSFHNQRDSVPRIAFKNNPKMSTNE